MVKMNLYFQKENIYKFFPFNIQALLFCLFFKLVELVVVDLTAVNVMSATGSNPRGDRKVLLALLDALVLFMWCVGLSLIIGITYYFIFFSYN